IIMKTQDYGETHKIVTICSESLGKFSAIARGAKKPKSRMAAVTQPFIYGQYLVYVSRGLSTLQQGTIIESFRPIREDIEKTAYAAYILELTDKLVDSKRPDPYLFKQLYETIKWISEHDESHIPIMMYELKLFAKGGIAPVIDKCVNCGENETSLFAFSIREGGLLCQKCVHLDQHSVPLTNVLVKLLSIFSLTGLEQVGTISVKDENKQLLRQLLDAYYDQYGGYFLKTRKFIKQMSRLAKD